MVEGPASDSPLDEKELELRGASLTQVVVHASPPPDAFLSAADTDLLWLTFMVTQNRPELRLMNVKLTYVLVWKFVAVQTSIATLMIRFLPYFHGA